MRLLLLWRRRRLWRRRLLLLRLWVCHLLMVLLAGGGCCCSLLAPCLLAPCLLLLQALWMRLQQRPGPMLLHDMLHLRQRNLGQFQLGPQECLPRGVTLCSSCWRRGRLRGGTIPPTCSCRLRSPGWLCTL